MANPENGLEWFSKRLIETLPAAVCVCNADAVIVAFNKRATELWGRSPRPGQTHEKYCGSHKLFWPDGTYLPHDQTSMEWYSETVSRGVTRRRSSSGRMAHV